MVVANKSVIVRVGVDATPAIVGLDRLDKKGKQVGKSLTSSFDSATASLGRNHEAANRVANGIITVGAAAGAALVASGIAAVQWESQFTGVRKTVDDTATGMLALEGELRGLARSLPASHKEIAAVAEAAGQLGIERKSITAFTKTMIDLGETTNLSSQEASESLAQFMNIMGTSQELVGRLGAVIVDLGNNGASTEKDIVQMGLRIAGAGKQIGLTEAQTLAMASSLASLGINAEAGGTAISRTMVRIDQAVRNGGKRLEILGQITDQTGEQFKKSFQEDAGKAINDLVLGLGRMSGSGKDVNGVLKSLGITGIYEADALRRLAAATKSAGAQQDLLSTQLKIGTTAWAQNTALIDEANKRYDTAASKAKVAWNVIKDEAISTGQTILPVIAQIATGVAAMVNVFEGMPGPVRTAGVSLLGAVAAVGLLGGGTLKAVTSIAAMRTGLQALGVSAQFAGRALRVAGLSIPVIGIAIFAVTEAIMHFTKETATSTGEVETFDAAIQTLTGDLDRNTAALNENVRQAAIQNLQQRGALDLAEKLGLSVRTVTDAVLGEKDAIAEVNRVIAEGLAVNRTASKGDADRQDAAIGLSEALNDVALAEIESLQAAQQRKDANEGITQAERDVAEATGLTAEEVRRLGTAEADLTKKEDDLVKATRKMRNELSLLKGEALNAEEATLAWESAIDAASESVKTNGKTVNKHTEEGRNNRTSIINMVRALDQKTTADLKNGESTKKVTARFEDNRRQLIKVATQMTGNKKEATKMIDEFLSTPKELRTKVSAPTKAARGEISDLKREIDKLKKKIIDLEFTTNAGKLAGQYKVKASRAVAPGTRNIPRADAGPTPKLDEGGTIRGQGGPRQDNVMGIDPHTGLQTSWVSVGEFVVNAKAYQKNREAIEAINAGQQVEMIKLAGGGMNTGRRLNNGPLNRGRQPLRGRPHDQFVGIDAIVPRNIGPVARQFADVVGDRLGYSIGENLGANLGVYLRGLEAKAIAAEAKAAAAATGGGLSGGKSTGVSGSGRAGARAAALRLGASPVFYHSETGSGRPAFDAMVRNDSIGNAVARHLVNNHGKYGGYDVIWNRGIWSARGGWRRRPYRPIRSTGDYWHDHHVHAAFPDGGLVGEPSMAAHVANALGIPIKKLDTGGSIPPGPSLILNGTRRPEMVPDPRPRTLVRSYQAGGAVTRSSAAAPQVEANVVVYVENPFTGEQVQARVIKIADDRILVHQRSEERRFDL